MAAPPLRGSCVDSSVACNQFGYTQRLITARSLPVVELVRGMMHVSPSLGALLQAPGSCPQGARPPGGCSPCK